MNRIRKMLKLNGRSGFTVVELLLTVIVLAILLGISMPAIYQFIQRKDLQDEENAQLEIRKALQAYLQEKNQLPASSTWFADLAGYTNLSQEQMQLDVWKRPRMFITYTDTSRELLGSPVPVYYVSIHSSGPDRKADAATGIAVSGNDFAATSSNNWWARMFSGTTPVTVFSTLKSGGDDIMVKFTDYADKISRYELTVQRLDRIATSLESYARNLYAQRVAFCSDNANALDSKCVDNMPEKTIYYPKSEVYSSTGVVATDAALYYDDSVVVKNKQDTASDTERREGMVAMMRKFGLPDDYCCSALSTSTDLGAKPFFYFSNPRPRNTSTCGTRPGVDSTKLPARLTTEYNGSCG